MAQSPQDQLQDAKDKLGSIKSMSDMWHDSLKRVQKAMGEIVGLQNKSLQTQLDLATLGKASILTTKALYSAYSAYDKLLSDSAKQLGVGKDEIDGIYSSIQAANQQASAFAISNEKILQSTIQFRQEYAIAGKALLGVGKSAAAISRATGLSAKESADFQSRMAEIGGTSLQTQKNMGGVAKLAADAAGVPLGQVLRDVAKSSDSVRAIFKGNTVELVKQAAELRRIGSNLDAAAKSAESLLNFESSINSQLKLSALLGKQVNFNKARELFFAGKVEEGEKAILEQLNKIGDIQNLNYFQRKALADATGKSIGDLQKMQTQQKNLVEAEREFPELAEKRNEMMREMGKLQKSASESRKEELQSLLEQQIADQQNERFLQAKQQLLNSIGKLMKPIVDGLINAATLLANFTAKILNMVSVFTGAFGTAGKIIGGLIVTIGTLIGTFIILRKTISGVSKAVGKGFGQSIAATGSGIGKGMTAASKGITSMGRSLATFPWSAVGKIAVLLGLATLAAMGFAKAFSMLGKTTAGQIIAFTVALIALGAGLAAIGILLTGPQILGVLAFAAAMGVLSLAAMGIGKAMEWAANGVEKIGNVFEKVANVVMKGVVTMFSKLLETIQVLPGALSGLVMPLIKLAAIAPLIGVAAASLGVFSASLLGLSASLLLFPKNKFVEIADRLITLAKVGAGLENTGKSLSDLFTIDTGSAIVTVMESLSETLTAFPMNKLERMVAQLTELGKAGEGIKVAVASIKELSGLDIPSLDVNLSGIENASKLESTKTQTKELKDGLDVIAGKLDQLTGLLLSGGIAVNLDGVKVNQELASSAYRRGSRGSASSF